MAYFPTHDENIRQSMDWKRRGDENAVATAAEADERIIKEGHTTIVERPSYGVVRDRGYLDQPVD